MTKQRPQIKKEVNLFTQEEGKTNKNCALARNGFKPYERCNYCQLKVKSCSGMHLNLYTFLIGFFVLMFIFIEDPMLIRLNVILVIGLFFALGYEVTVSTDALARADFMNQGLNAQLQKHSGNLENEIKERTDELQYLAIHDTVTGLYNRYEFEKRLNFSLSTSPKDSAAKIMCYLNLDQFKVVNDTSGHIAGDELLKQTAYIVKSNVDSKDIVARLGGDEFGILFVGKTLQEAELKARKILDDIKEYRFLWKEKLFVIGASMGMVQINHENNSFVDIIAQADAACYLAKEQGRNRIHIAREDDKKLEERRDEMQWLSKMTIALEEDSYLLYVQPIVSLLHKNESFKHYEVLVRMQEDDGRIIPPMAFIPVAEKYGMMKRIDKWVIENVFKAYIELQRETSQLYRFSINLSGLSLNDSTLQPFIEDLFRRYHVPYSAICFEVTETAAISNMSVALSFINHMRKLGCKTSLDDFGSGLSSFSYLQSIPVDYLKIDGAFVQNIDTNKINRAMVKSINEIGHVMGMKTICEFVENEKITEILNEMGVDYAQGYYYAKPQPIKSLLEQA